MEMRRRKVLQEVPSGDVRPGETFTYRGVRYRCTHTPEKALNPRHVKIFVRHFMFWRRWVFIHCADMVTVKR